MKGVGDHFDPMGLFSREQAIATMLRLFGTETHTISYYHLALKGIAYVDPNYDNLHFTVGKDYIYVDYPDEKYWENNADHLYADMERVWNEYTDSNQLGPLPSLAQGVAVYYFSILQTYTPEVTEAAFKNKSITVDFGCMDYTILTDEHVIEIKLKPGYELMTVVGGYYYGYPRKDVEPKVID
ncbi:MAG TPA: hypothetical protein VEA58_06750 [Anaerovoracaceae bacterium]|nr:hypothetical protein [Anaerovoracaceae bacterium]